MVTLYRCRYCEKEMPWAQGDSMCSGNPRVGTHSLSLTPISDNPGGRQGAVR
jgi:hypothetical protein